MRTSGIGTETLRTMRGRRVRTSVAGLVCACLLFAGAGAAAADEPPVYTLDVLSCVLYDPDFNVVADNTAPAGAEVILFEGWIANTRGQVVSFVNNVTWILTVDGQRADVLSNLTGVIRVGPTEWGDIFVIAGTPIGSGQTITTRYDLVLKSASFDGVFHYKKGSVYGGGVTCSVTGA